MTAANFPACLAAVLQFEGGWSDNENDPGGPTMKGVTLATFQSFYPGATVTDLQNITDAQLQAIYGSGYWQPVQGDELPSGVDLCVFDFGVNAGPGRAAKMLQDVVGAPQDGVIGPQTLLAVEAWARSTLITNYCTARQAYYETLSGYDEFGVGWSRRVQSVQAQSLALATQGT